MDDETAEPIGLDDETPDVRESPVCINDAAYALWWSGANEED